MQPQTVFPPLVQIGRRRWLLQAGLGALAGLSVPQILQGRAAAAERGRPQSPTSVIRGGQVIGSTDRRGGEIRERPLGPGDLAATVFQHLGIDPYDHWISSSGRPTPLVEKGKPIAELF